MVAAPIKPQRQRGRVALFTSLAVGVVVVAFVAVLAVSRPSSSRVDAESPLIGQPAPELVGQTIDGTSYDLGRERSRWVLLNFFATWCVPCREEHDDLMRFDDRHRAVGDARVVAVVYADAVGAVRAFRADEGGDWPMVIDPDGRIAVSYGVAGVPESFLIAPDGTVVTKLVGGVRDIDLEALLAQVSGRPAPSSAGGKR